ncbi:GldL-related protein [Membranihabitans maritimus]|uniref:GldL-related protein n=1 Tax=Membranihabitans maritimus TaxID=2904244 RepID=UPI001F2B1265|nr:gliding motility protein GldL [Membranihabitans maritimus]
MSFYKKSWFKYLKNFIIGVGAALVMMGALGKINSYEWGGTAITIGLVTEALLFLMLGILPPEKDYYWENLYPGLDKANAGIEPLTNGAVATSNGQPQGKPLDSDFVENHLDGMLGELRTMSKSMSSLKALQEVDFSQTGDQIKSMNNFYDKLNTAMSQLEGSVEDAKQYKENMAVLNQKLNSLNTVYGNMLNAMNVKQQ